jgi:hypothetical protein
VLSDASLLMQVSEADADVAAGRIKYAEELAVAMRQRRVAE